MTLHFKVLGPLEATRDDVPADLGSFRQRAVLALLLTRPGAVVSTDTLLEELWSGADGDRQSSLWVYVSNLRSTLEPDRAKRTEGTVLLTRQPGYLVSLTDAELDAQTFEALLGRARATIENDPAEAALVLRDALGLWRGRPYEEFGYEPWAIPEIDRLEELRLQAIELRIDADLRLGASSKLVSELEALHRDHPLREQFVEQLMLALHRSGRTADALRVFKAHATRLGQELGIEPARTVRELEERILNHDETLLASTTRVGRGIAPGLAVRGYELREKIGEGAFGVAYRAFHAAVGREVAVKVIRPELADDPAFIRRFESEARLVARLEHPHIVPLYDYWREPGAAYLVMRLMTGSTLADRLVSGALESDEVALMVDQLTRALAAAHQLGVVHQDIKPENVLLDANANSYLSDFGVAVGAGDPSPTQPVLATLAPPYASPEQLSGLPVDSRTDTFSLAVVIAQALTGISVDYQQIRGGLEARLTEVLDRATSMRPSDRWPSIRSFGLEVIEALGAEPHTVVFEEDAYLDNPYKGLRAFTSADRAVFFGRERAIERLVSRLADPGPASRFIAVVGPSGSGKSSVVRAGLAPAIVNGALAPSVSWVAVEMTPGSQPLEALESALLTVAVAPPPSLVEMIERSGLPRTIEEILPDQSQLLLVIDQFEELYTIADPSSARAFIDQIVALSESSRSRVRTVITLRSDFYDTPVRDRALGELLRTGTELITPMTGDELKRAIIGPAERVGVRIDQGVVRSMVQECVEQPGALPLLQYTLSELFDRRTGRSIDAKHYEEIGGVTGSLIRRADSILDQLSRNGAETARQVFLRLVTIGDDGASDTRRRALAAELRSIGDPQDVDTVLEAFGRRRLLSFDRDPVSRAPTVEIAHESLLTEWTAFRNWIEDGREDLSVQRSIRLAAREWEKSGREPGFLLSGARLERAEEWLTETDLAVSQGEGDFIEFSSYERNNRLAAQAAREEEAVRAEERAVRRTKQLSIVAAITALMVVIAGFAFVQRRDAVAAREQLDATNRALVLAGSSTSVLQTDPALAALLAVEAVQSTATYGFATPDALDAIHWALQELGVTYPVTEGTPAYIRPGPNGATGVWGIPIDQLITLANESVAPRALTGAECARYASDSDCPSDPPDSTLDVLGGWDGYSSAVGEAEVTVLVRSPFGEGSEVEELLANLEPVAEGSGLSIIHRKWEGSVLDAAIAGGEGAIHLLAQPGTLPDIAREHRLLDLGSFLDRSQLEEDFGSYLTSLSTIGSSGTWPSSEGPVVGIFHRGDVKSLIWTNADRFAESGHPVPSTWRDFAELVEAGAASEPGSPLCFGLDADAGFAGWPGTDLVENWILKSRGPAFYDAWVGHEVPFDHPAVVQAITEIGRVFLAEGGVFGGAADATNRFFARPALQLWGDEGAPCSMAPGASFFPILFDSFGPDVEPSIGSFSFPTIDPDHSTAVLGGATLLIAFEDRPEVRAIMTAAASPEWSIPTMSRDVPGAVPMSARFDPANIVNPAFVPLHAMLRDAVTSESFRFDGSDQMPEEIGGNRGAFHEGMLRLFREGNSQNVEAVAAEIAGEIEAVWASLESTDD